MAYSPRPLSARKVSGRGVEPASLTLRAEVLEVVRQCADEYGLGSPFVTEEYFRKRTPVMSMQAMETTVPRCQPTPKKPMLQTGQIHRKLRHPNLGCHDLEKRPQATPKT